MEFLLEGPPIAKARHRHMRRDNATIVYDPRQAEARSQRQRILDQMAAIGYPMWDPRPLVMEIRAYRPIPSGISKKEYNRMVNAPDVRRPDLDNFIKFYLDICNAAAYIDDRYITTIYATKQYSDRPRVEIEIYPDENKILTT